MNKQSFQKFYRKWLSDEGYPGIHLVIGFVVALTGGILFMEVADLVFESSTVYWFDNRVQELIKPLILPEVTRLMIFITFFGNRLTLTLMSVLVGGILLWKRSRRRLYTFVATMACGGLLNELLKLYYARQRPEAHALIRADGYSFPSGHAMGSTLFFAALGYVLFFSVKRSFFWRFLGVGFCALAAFLIGFSRIYLGVHYASDVIAGFIAGITWTAICIFSTEAWIRWRDRKRKLHCDQEPSQTNHRDL